MGLISYEMGDREHEASRRTGHLSGFERLEMKWLCTGSHVQRLTLECCWERAGPLCRRVRSRADEWGLSKEHVEGC